MFRFATLVFLVSGLFGLTGDLIAQEQRHSDKFRQLDEIWPTPSQERRASGAPGSQYWQQRADYEIKARLDESAREITASEILTYHNNSPDALGYLWLQLDQNQFDSHSDFNLTRTTGSLTETSMRRFRAEHEAYNFDGGLNIKSVRDHAGNDLPFTVIKTMMRVDLPEPLISNARFVLDIDWSFKVTSVATGSRNGYEYFPDDDNDLYQITQWYPRMAAYTDAHGWLNKQFIGAGEFTLEFGDFYVELTVPADHVVAATGELQNPLDVLTTTQQARLQRAKTADKPVMIITPGEALDNESSKDEEYHTWKYSASQVRDFAFASSRKFIWDAMGVAQKGMDGQDHTIMAMSYYPKEANPLWGTYSTQSVAHTLHTYSRFTFPYPYPVALSVNGATGGMEYPMIAFTHTRPTKNDDGEQTYTRQLKYAVIGVITHEVGHNYFPMIINTDERHWSWMDEGMNTFIGYLALEEWEEDYPSGRGGPRAAISQMISPRQMPIMTSADSLINRGGNAYTKTSAALVVLRETILGRQSFDRAFKEYARRWMFKRPMPTDFFRTMEDVSGVDLDWFWNGWFYSTDHVDIALDKVSRLRIDTKDPEIEKAWQEEERMREPLSRVRANNGDIEFMLDRHPELGDFYNEYDAFTVTNKDRNQYNNMLGDLEDYERELLEVNDYIYQLDFTNKGGLVMPIILSIEYLDGQKETLTLPAEIWARNTNKVSSRVIRDREIVSVEIDPFWETGDVERHDNHYPRIIETSTLELTTPEERSNLMEDIKVELGGPNSE